MIKRIFSYLEPLWTGADDKISLKSVIAIFLTYKLIENLDYAIQKWDSNKNIADVSSLFLTLAGLIAALLGITAWSNMTSKKIDTLAEEHSHLPHTVTVEKEERITSGSRVISTNGDSKVDTVDKQSKMVTSSSEPENDK